MKASLSPLFAAAALALVSSLTIGCSSDGSTPHGPGTYLRSDSPELTTGWQAKMPVYRASHQSEQAIAESLGLDSATRAPINDDPNRVSYSSASGRVELFFDEGFDQPFHALHYLRSEPFVAQTWANSAELRHKWETGASLAADYFSKLTQLTPVVFVGHATDAEYAAALTDGYTFILAVEGRLVWVDDLEVRVDAQGVAEFATDELVFDATPNGSVDCLTQAEVQAIITQGGYATPDPSLPPPIFYGFDTEQGALSPFYLATGATEGGLLAIPLDRAATN